MVSPSRSSVADSSRRSPMNVPLRLPRSARIAAVAETEILAWRRETDA
jgi:hypothetical protein